VMSPREFVLSGLVRLEPVLCHHGKVACLEAAGECLRRLTQITEIRAAVIASGARAAVRRGLSRSALEVTEEQVLRPLAGGGALQVSVLGRLREAAVDDYRPKPLGSA